jgi:P4 family phage/plasmid primase-like protien
MTNLIDAITSISYNDNKTLSSLTNKIVMKYIKYNLIGFGLNIEIESGKKKLQMPNNWTEITEWDMSKYKNGFALLTGNKNKLFVVDVDNMEHWSNLLKETRNEEPRTVKVKTAKGIHLYFNYNEKVSHIKSNNKCITLNGTKLDIDIKSNGGCVIAPPSKYENGEYKWERSLFTTELLDVPDWLINLLEPKELVESREYVEYIEEEDNTNMDIERLVSMLNIDRSNDYDNWLQLGMCLHTIDKRNLEIWDNWSKINKKYKKGECEKKWKSFKKQLNRLLTIGSLIHWVKEDNLNEYKNYKRELQTRIIIKENKSKFPDNKLEISKIIMNDDLMYIELNYMYCPIRKKEHLERSVYLELTPHELVLKCHKRCCVGKKYPSSNIPLNKNTLKNVFNMTINNDSILHENSELNEIQIFDDITLNNLMLESITGTTYKIAEVLYYLNKDTFNYGEDKEWYEYKKHRWVKSNGLRSYISKKLVNYYKKMIEKNKNEDELIKKTKKIIYDLESTYFKNNIITEAEEIFRIENNPEGNFVSKLDINIYLLGFNNGVYDLETNTFRSGIPSDNISYTVGYNYSERSEYIENVNDMIEKILPNKKLKDYVLKTMSVCLSGKIIQKVILLNGIGSNGKSMLLNLLCETMGDYFTKSNITMILQNRPLTEGATPQLCKLLKKRCVLFSEPNENDKLNTGVIKELSGGEKISIREMYKTADDFMPMFKLFILCNHLPTVSEKSYGIWRRLRNIQFTSKFVENPVKDNEYLLDPDLNIKLKEWKNAFMLVLLKYWKKYQIEGLLDIEEIDNSTMKYKNENDYYEEFIKDHITEDKTKYIKWTELLKVFNEWFEMNYKKNSPNPKDIKNALIEKIFKCNESVNKIDKISCRIWKGYKLNSTIEY